MSAAVSQGPARCQLPCSAPSALHHPPHLPGPSLGSFPDGEREACRDYVPARAQPGRPVPGPGPEAFLSEAAQRNPHGDSLTRSLPSLFQLRRLRPSNVHLVTQVWMSNPTPLRYRHRTLPLNVAALCERHGGWWLRGGQRRTHQSPSSTMTSAAGPSHPLPLPGGPCRGEQQAYQ